MRRSYFFCEDWILCLPTLSPHRRGRRRPQQAHSDAGTSSLPQGRSRFPARDDAEGPAREDLLHDAGEYFVVDLHDLYQPKIPLHFSISASGKPDSRKAAFSRRADSVSPAPAQAGTEARVPGASERSQRNGTTKPDYDTTAAPVRRCHPVEFTRRPIPAGREEANEKYKFGLLHSE